MVGDFIPVGQASFSNERCIMPTQLPPWRRWKATDYLSLPKTKPKTGQATAESVASSWLMLSRTSLAGCYAILDSDHSATPKYTAAWPENAGLWGRTNVSAFVLGRVLVFCNNAGMKQRVQYAWRRGIHDPSRSRRRDTSP